MMSSMVSSTGALSQAIRSSSRTARISARLADNPEYRAEIRAVREELRIACDRAPVELTMDDIIAARDEGRR